MASNLSKEAQALLDHLRAKATTHAKDGEAVLAAFAAKYAPDAVRWQAEGNTQALSELVIAATNEAAAVGINVQGDAEQFFRDAFGLLTTFIVPKV